MVDIAHRSAINPASVRDATASRGRNPEGTAPLIPLASVDLSQWQSLSERAIEPNGYYLPGWELAVSASAHGRTGTDALRAVDASNRLTGL
ncbi:MAG: GNAT family N-acetyltransferase, partial [Bradyrhizobium guangdongense]